MTNILFPRDWVKLSPSKRSRIQDDRSKMDSKISAIEDSITALKRKRDTLQTILDVDQKRSLIALYWDSVSPEDRKNFGKSRDEIENGYNAKSHSVISYEHVGKYSWKELNEFWQGTFLAGMSGQSVDALMELVKELEQPLSV